MRIEVLLFLALGFLIGCRTLGRDALSGRDSERRSFTATPDEARIITTDIDHFWRAFDSATPLNDVRIYQEEYLERGTVGLREFARLKIGSPRNLAQRVWKHSSYYASVRSTTLAIHAKDHELREIFRKLHQLYSDALFPDVFFVIGPMTSGGIATNDGIIIGAELFSETDSSPLDELNSWERSVIKPIEKIPQVVAHELIHFQQNFQKDPETLLERSIAEGSADFLSEMVAGAQVNELQHAYGEQHEEELWREFRDQMNGRDYSRWLYNGTAFASGGNPDGRPADMGYYIGYKISQAFYENATDKTQAVRDILQIADFNRFFKESNYEVRLAARASDRRPQIQSHQ